MNKLKEILLAKNTLYAIITYSLIITILRAIRYPNEWARAHWLISYKFGFIKRALIGTIVSPFIDQFYIYLISSLLLLLFFSALLIQSLQVLKKQNNIENILLVSVFVTSPFIVMSAHTNGYYDNILFMIAIISCMFVKNQKTWFQVILQAVGVLVHENYIVIALPVVLFYAYVTFLLENNYLNNEVENNVGIWQIHIEFIKKYGYLIGVPIFTFAVIAAYQALFVNLEELHKQLVDYFEKIPYIYYNGRVELPKAFTFTFMYYLTRQYIYVPGRLFDIRYLVGIEIPLVLFYYKFYLSYIKGNFKNILLRKIVLSILVLLVQLPLILFAIAWDKARIWSYTYFIVFAMYVIISQILNKKEYNNKFNYKILVILFFYVVFNSLIQYKLMDFRVDNFSYLQKAVLYLPLIIYLGYLLKIEYQSRKQNLDLQD